MSRGFSDTIFALSSGAGRAGVSVIRVSGPGVVPVLEKVTGRPCPPARRAVLRELSDNSGERVDRGLVIYFEAPHSFTGEHVAELQVHGGLAVIDAVFGVLIETGARLAEPGEFSRRAFHAGKMDLTQAEAISDLIASETRAQLRQANGQADGSLRDLYDGWRHSLIKASALMEAQIDFADEDLPDDLWQSVVAAVDSVLKDIDDHLSQGPRGERLRNGVRVAILGLPNAGKSSLLNALAGRDVAIVSETAGTTRDVIEVHLDLDGLPVTVWDTAGLRQADKAIEKEGVARALSRAAEAEIRVWLSDAAEWPVVADLDRPMGENDLLVHSKYDLMDVEATHTPDSNWLAVSTQTGDGLADLLAKLTELAGRLIGNSEAPVMNRARHRQALEDCRDGLRRLLEQDLSGDMAMPAEDLRQAIYALGRLTGRVDVEDILDVVFAEFCIGK